MAHTCAVHQIAQRTIDEASDNATLITLRRRSGVILGGALVRVGRSIHVHGNVIGEGRVARASRRGNGDDEVVAVGALLQIGGELILPAVELLSTGKHYAGAALVRQLVEVEYLMWAFASDPPEARRWLNSTKQERMEFFQPRHLRQKAKGRFRDKDYAYHCELGGHPVPRSLSLIGGADSRIVQLLVVDILLHGWRIADSAVEWSTKKLPEIALRELRSARHALTMWSKADPLYALPESP